MRKKSGLLALEVNLIDASDILPYLSMRVISHGSSFNRHGYREGAKAA